MWAVMSFPIPKPTSQPISGKLPNSQPSRHRSSVNQKQQQPPQQPTKKNRENQKGAVTNQLSGLDVLWAMQKAADEKTRVGRIKRNRKREESESESKGRKTEEYVVDYSNTRPLLIKDEWGGRLDELDKRLQELLDTK